jgi:hypothetical protein
MKKNIQILLFVFVAKNAFTQDTIPIKERSFFKNIYFVNEFSRSIEHANIPTDYFYINNKVGIAKVSEQFKIETGFDLFRIPSEDNTLIQTSAAFNLLHLFKKNNKWSLFFGASHLYYYSRDWDVTYEGKIFDGFVEYYYGIKLKGINKDFHLLSLDLQLLYGRFALAYNYAHYTSLLRNVSLSEGMSRFCISYYQPLYKNKASVNLKDSVTTLQRNNLFISLGVSNFLISYYNIYATGGTRPPFALRVEKEKEFIRLPNVKTGMAFLHKNFLQQININGPFVLTAEYSLSYNLQPLFNNYKPSFTGLDIGYHINYYTLSWSNSDAEKLLFSNMHLGLLHITKKRLYYGIYNYSLLPKMYRTERSAEYIRVNIELRFGYFLSVLKNRNNGMLAK